MKMVLIITICRSISTVQSWFKEEKKLNWKCHIKYDKTCSNSSFDQFFMCLYLKVWLISSFTVEKLRMCSPTFSMPWCRPTSQPLWIRRGPAYVSKRSKLWMLLTSGLFIFKFLSLSNRFQGHTCHQEGSTSEEAGLRGMQCEGRHEQLHRVSHCFYFGCF